MTIPSRARFEQSPVTRFRRLALLRDVLEGDQRRQAVPAQYRFDDAGIHAQYPPPRVAFILFEFQIAKSCVSGIDQLTQRVEQPLILQRPAADLRKTLAHRIRAVQMKMIQKRPIHVAHRERAVQHRQRLADGIDDRLGIVAGIANVFQLAKDFAHVEKLDQGAFNAVIRRAVRPNTENVPAPFLISDLLFPRDQRVEHALQHLLEIGYAEPKLNIGDRQAYIARDQMQHVLGDGSKTPDAQIAAQA